MFFFFKFHRKLVRENKTTIENIEHNSEEGYKSKYDINFWHNVYQVMGTNKWIWWIPIMPSSNMPKGQGIYYDKNQESEDSSEDEEDNRPNNYANRNSNENNDSRAQNVVERLTNVREGSQVNNRNGANGSNHVQADRMTIHDERQNKWENLNNIVQSDNVNQVYKSSGSEENSHREETKAAYSKFTNKVTPRVEETKGRQYFEKARQAAPSKGTAVGAGGRAEGERADSKTSTGQLIRKSKGAIAGQKVIQKGGKGLGHPQRDTAKGRTGRPAKKRGTATSKGRIGAGFR